MARTDVNITVAINQKNGDVTQIARCSDRKPQVLLVGNGLDMLFKAPSWNDLLWSIAKDMGLGITLKKLSSLPAPLQYESLNQLMVGDRREELIGKIQEANTIIKRNFEDTSYQSKSNLIYKILTLDLDAIVTTNYTHLFENACLSSEMYRGTECSNHVVCKKLTTKEGKSLKLYHLHGDLEVPESIVLGHHEYAECITELRNNRGSGGLTDLLMAADIYTLGHSLSEDEIDLWWLLSEKVNHRRNDRDITLRHYTANYFTDDELLKQQKNTPEEMKEKIGDYAQKKECDDAKRWLITALKGKTVSLGYYNKLKVRDGKRLSYTKKQNGKTYACQYIVFYRAVVDAIEKLINKA